ncbi:MULTISPECIES: polysaccharide deacetylase family protein [Roseomonadaceae]|uniref:Chitooligosaccharide deacetylase n=1 Tax=Falsiroseomonas oleicola TaxID=2801474 RepID=A0ABS6H565_9PROT|nr:polysaccharide deacetylase family protein [Roseomonas oleicola]MBU8543811.1 polysaccharide deacetylase family protein [Roseomonas oleicola]
MKLPSHSRYAPSAIPTRPTYTWPNGAKLAVIVCNNIEHFAFRAGMGSDSAQVNAPQSARNYAWRDYGNRVGLWNMLDMLDELEIPSAHNVNSAALDYMPEIAPALLKRGDEFIGHGRSNAERQDTLWEDDERRLIVETRDAITRHAGAPPTGWLGPYLAQSNVTLDLLREEGFRYMMDLPADDQPFWMATRAGPILSVPYSIELNDSPAMVFRQHSGREFADMITDQFDEMLEQSKKRPLVCSIVLHTFVVGQPFRLRPLRNALRHILTHRDDIWLTRPGDLATYATNLPQGTIPGSEMLGEAR